MLCLKTKTMISRLHLCHRYTPSILPLSIQEIDECQIGKFSFRTQEAVLNVSLNTRIKQNL